MIRPLTSILIFLSMNWKKYAHILGVNVNVFHSCINNVNINNVRYVCVVCLLKVHAVWSDLKSESLTWKLRNWQKSYNLGRPAQNK